MHNWSAKITNIAVQKQIIAAETAEWFQYGLEKRIVALLGLIPFVIVATILTEPVVALSFYCSFHWLRVKTNGFHSDKLSSCFAISSLLVILFCGILYRFLNSVVVVVCTLLSLLVVFTLAPYRHPNLPLSQDDIISCRQLSRIRSCVISALILISLLTKLNSIYKGLTMGITMTSFMLCIPYILQKGGTQDEQV